MVMRFLVLSFLCLFFVGLEAQNKIADSLRDRLYKQADNDTTRINILNRLAYELRYDSAQRAYKYAQESLALSENINFIQGTAVAYGLIGLSQWSQANFSSALKNLLTGFAIADSLNLVQAKADITGYIGLVYGSLGEYQQALNYQLQSQQMQHQLKNGIREAITLNSIGDCYLQLKSYRQALTSYQQALELGAPYHFGEASNYRNIGNVYETEGKLDKALKFYFISKKICDDNNFTRSKTQVCKSIASIYFKQKKYDSAEYYLNEGIAIAKEGNLRAILRDYYKLFSNVKEAQNKLSESLHFYKLFNEWEDSIQNDVESSKIASLQLDYEMQHKRMEIDGLKKDAQIQAEDLQQKNVLLVAITVAFLLVVAFLVYTIRNYRQQKKLSIELAARNTEINRQRTELAQQRDKAIVLNEEIYRQQQEINSQRNVLVEKNKSIEQLHKSVTDANQHLEAMVAKRTNALIEQNKRLEEYTFINTTKLMEPASIILSAVDSLTKKESSQNETVLINDLKKSSENLDKVIRSIGDTLQHGLTAYEKQK